jgi:hypothetical protein
MQIFFFRVKAKFSETACMFRELTKIVSHRALSISIRIVA